MVPARDERRRGGRGGLAVGCWRDGGVWATRGGVVGPEVGGLVVWDFGGGVVAWVVLVLLLGLGVGRVGLFLRDDGGGGALMC